MDDTKCEGDSQQSTDPENVTGPLVLMGSEQEDHVINILTWKGGGATWKVLWNGRLWSAECWRVSGFYSSANRQSANARVPIDPAIKTIFMTKCHKASLSMPAFGFSFFQNKRDFFSLAIIFSKFQHVLKFYWVQWEKVKHMYGMGLCSWIRVAKPSLIKCQWSSTKFNGSNPQENVHRAEFWQDCSSTPLKPPIFWID